MRRPSAPRSRQPASPRGDLHVTTKVWHENLAPDAIRRAFDASLKKLRLDHVDLYLVHWPSKNMNLPAIFETLMKLKEEGRTRAIGVANFTVALLKTVVEEIKAPIACNQVEYHVMLDQTPLRKYLAAKSIPLVAYCPLAQGKVASDATLTAIGRKHGASAAQVALKWLLDQDGVAAIPKASRAESQQANLDALNVGLDDEDMKAIAASAERQALRESRIRPGVGLGIWRCGAHPSRRAQMRAPRDHDGFVAGQKKMAPRGAIPVSAFQSIVMAVPDDHHPVGVVMVPALVPAVIAVLAEFGARAEG